MQVLAKIDKAGVEIEEAGLRIACIGKQIRNMTVDGVIDQGELRRLHSISDALAHESFGLSVQSDKVEDVGLDLKVAGRCIKHGREVAVNIHVKRAVIDLDEVRAARAAQRETSGGDYPPEAA